MEQFCNPRCMLFIYQSNKSPFKKIGEGHIKIRPEYVSVITHKTSFCKHNFVNFLVTIVLNTDIIRLHFLSALLYNMPFGRPKKTRLD